MSPGGSSVGRICIYCSRPVGSDDRVAVCDRCYAAHHEDCWERNGRCSTFRCSGAPRTMRGADLAAVLQTALEKANAEPRLCPFCGGEAYGGLLQSVKPVTESRGARLKGLLFVARETGNARGGLMRRLMGKVRPRNWPLPGGHLRARSCGRCRRLFIWGVPVDDAFLVKVAEGSGERFCPHCSGPLTAGAISLNPKAEGGAQFECEDAPNFHKDWLGHNLLDRYFLNRWAPPVPEIPAHSCEACKYTEIAGRPVYRFL